MLVTTALAAGEVTLTIFDARRYAGPSFRRPAEAPIDGRRRRAWKRDSIKAATPRDICVGGAPHIGFAFRGTGRHIVVQRLILSGRRYLRQVS